MEENRISRTALGTAFVRAYHVLNDTPKIFDDNLAYHMLTGPERRAIEQSWARSIQLAAPAQTASSPDQASALSLYMRALPFPSITISRARYTEDNLEEAVRQGVKQYVILGAGLDTFAFRRRELLEQLQVFEVDHPAMQAFKRRRLADLGWDIPTKLHFVPVDFTQESLEAALKFSSYDPQAPSFFSWLGVTYYLTRQAVFATLRTIAGIAPAGSMVIFDYLETDALVPEILPKKVQAMLENLRRLGEPLITGFDPPALVADLKHLGLALHEDLGPAEIEGRYFHGRTDGYHASEYAHFAWAVVE